MNPTTAKQQTGQQPTIGRTVLYNYSTPVPLRSRVEHQTTCPQAPGIIQHVNPDGTIRLCVFGPNPIQGAGGYEVIDSVQLNVVPAGGVPLPGSWMWPTRT